MMVIMTVIAVGRQYRAQGAKFNRSNNEVKERQFPEKGKRKKKYLLSTAANWCDEEMMEKRRRRRKSILFHENS